MDDKATKPKSSPEKGIVDFQLWTRKNGRKVGSNTENRAGKIKTIRSLFRIQKASIKKEFESLYSISEVQLPALSCSSSLVSV